MDLTSVKTIKTLLLKYNAHPSKRMGQNFLINQPTLNKIIEAADLNAKDTILEIGPGIGVLTQALAQNTKKVIAVEKDGVMVEILKETLASFNNVKIIQGNALKTDYYSLPTTNYKLVANIPYYITSPVLKMFLEAENPPSEMVLMVQKEVAQRICALPPQQNSQKTYSGRASLHKMSILAVSVQYYAKADIISYVSKECFWPSPKIDSAIIKIIPFDRKQKMSSENFFEIVKAGFSHPRKQLINNFSKNLHKSKEEIIPWLLKNSITPSQRAETLAVQDWVNLANSF